MRANSPPQKGFPLVERLPGDRLTVDLEYPVIDVHEIARFQRPKCLVRCSVRDHLCVRERARETG